MAASLRWGAATHPGQVRMNNEDAFAADDGCGSSPTGWAGTSPARSRSALTIDALRARRTGRGITSSDDLVAAVQEANDAIRREALTNPGRRGMGTTVTALAVMHHPDTPQLRRRQRRRLAHLPAGATASCSRSPSTTPTSRSWCRAARSPRARPAPTPAATSSPGPSASSPPSCVDTWTLAPVRGDRYMLCSDGLVDEVDRRRDRRHRRQPSPTRSRPPSGWSPSPTSTAGATT